MIGNITHGTHTNCTCPHCGRNNTYVTHGVVVPHNEIRVFKGTCYYCKQEIEYTASWELVVKAEPYPGEFTRMARKKKKPDVVEEKVDTPASNTGAQGREGSTPSIRTDDTAKPDVHAGYMNDQCSKCGRVYCDCESKY